MKLKKIIETDRRLFAVVMGLLFMINVSCGEERTEPVAEEEPLVTEETTEEEWNYENTDWGETTEGDCNTAVQSPVDIDPTKAIPARLPEIKYEYQPFQMNIVDNGHTIQASGTDSNFITIGDRRYQFRQFHYHAPSEHTVNGKAYPLEMHLVHQQEGSNNLAVIGVFIEEGTANPLLGEVFNRIPAEQEIEETTDLTVNLSDVIPPAQTYYTYLGSLTTPPCTVGVNWIVFTDPIQASVEQIRQFAEPYQNTARPVQPLENRYLYTTMK